MKILDILKKKTDTTKNESISTEQKQAIIDEYKNSSEFQNEITTAFETLKQEWLNDYIATNQERINASQTTQQNQSGSDDLEAKITQYKSFIEQYEKQLQENYESTENNSSDASVLDNQKNAL